jgi:lysophospholipase L1-like esterase
MGRLMTRLLILFVCTAFIGISCNGEETVDRKQSEQTFGADRLEPGRLQALAGKTIFFGHQSVGQNIVEGARELAGALEMGGLRIVEAEQPDRVQPGAFLHAHVGRNGDPASKVRDFSHYLEQVSSAGGTGPDFAFVKLCFVDIGIQTDVEEVFTMYKESMARLEAAHPQTTFVHFTVPLTVKSSGLKPLIKRVLGQPVYGVNDNIKREQYNQLVREYYDGKEPVFDLAEIESTLPDGSRVAYRKGDSTYYALAKEYTGDGGHLNQAGRRIAAEHLLLFLADLVTNN